MPFKDREEKLKYAKEYYKKNRAKLVKERAEYHAAHADEINERHRRNYALTREEKLENTARAIKIGGVYIGMCGMTRQQRERFWKELNGESKRP